MLKKRSHGKSQRIQNNSVTEHRCFAGVGKYFAKKMRWVIKFEAERCSLVLAVSVKLMLFHPLPQSFISIQKQALQFFICIMKWLQLDSIPVLLYKYPLSSG